MPESSLQLLPTNYARGEARELYKLLRNNPGETVERTRQLILPEIGTDGPTARYRATVLALFDLLVANGGVLPKRRTKRPLRRRVSHASRKRASR